MPKLSDHGVINAPKINAKENCENVNAFPENCIFVKIVTSGARQLERLYNVHTG